jgi:hypothetical protein
MGVFMARNVPNREFQIILIHQMVNRHQQVNPKANVNAMSTQCLGFDCFDARDTAREASGRSLEAISEQGQRST